MDAQASYTNGASRRLPGGRAAVGVEGSNEDPLRAVLSIGKASSGVVVGVILAILLHGTAAARAALIPVEMFRWTEHAAASVHAKLSPEIDLDVLKEPEPPPPPPEEVKEPPKEEAPPPPALAIKEPPKEPPSAPAAAKAAAVLTADPDPNDPVDLTNSIVTGTSSTFAGGTTQQGGTSDVAVRNLAAKAGGVAGGTGTVPNGAPPVDRSRMASCGAETSWDCPFPPEADTAQIDEAAVTLRATVGANGSVLKVEIVKDAGNGFGREAKRCAMARRCQPAFDASGTAVEGLSKNVVVHFSR